MFASNGIVEHVARGIVGMGALVAAVVVATPHPWLAVVAMAVALVALRGCPACWTIGLIETVASAKGDRGRVGTCVDGRCAPSARKAAERTT